MQVTTTRFFRHSDSGAPTLKGVAGELINILKLCLVGNGGFAYGGKRACGWSIAFEDQENKICVFRNSSTMGNGCYLHVNDSFGVYAEVQVYEIMSGIDLGSVPAASSTRYWIKAPAATNREWFLVGDERTFYMQTLYNGPNSTTSGVGNACFIFGAGDYIRFDGRPGVFLNGNASTSTTTGDYFNYIGWGSGTTNSSISITRNPSGSAVPTNARFGGLHTSGAGEAGSEFSLAAFVRPLWTRLPLLNIQYSPTVFLGYMRGIWHPLNFPLPNGEFPGDTFRPFFGNQFDEMTVFSATGSSTGTGTGFCGIETSRSWDIY